MNTELGFMTPISEQVANRIRTSFDYTKKVMGNKIKGVGIFEIGEIVALVGKESLFKITNITRHKLTLTLVSPSEKENLLAKTKKLDSMDVSQLLGTKQ